MTSEVSQGRCAPPPAAMSSDASAGRGYGVLAQCTLVAMLDGFDTGLIAFIAPVLTAEWHLSGTEMGQLLTAGLVGLMIGTVILGPLSDKVGRRPQLLLSVVLFAICTIASAMSGSMVELLFWRVITGIGLGGAVVCCFSLASECASPAKSGINVSIVKAAFPLGAAIGAVASSFLIAAGGWRLVVFVAGILPLLLFPVLYFKLPESPGFLAQQVGEIGLLRRLAPRSRRNAVVGDAAKTTGLLASLFVRERASATMLLWAICFLNLLTIYVLMMWLPTLLENKGFSLNVALYSSAVFTMSGVVTGLAFSAIIPRYGPARILGGACLAGILSVWGLSMSIDVGFIIFWAALAGGAILGTQFGTVVLLAGFYPVAIRSTGIGWALGVGRIGAILAPLLGGLALDAGFSADQLLQALGLPLIASALLLVLLSRVVASPAKKE